MKFRSFFFFAVILMTVFIGISQSQAYQLYLRPQEATLEPGDSLQFKVAVFNDLKQGVEPNRIAWRVEPLTLGRIAPNGLFVAGRIPGKGSVIATVSVGSQVITGRAQITIKGDANPAVKIRVEPERAHVPPLGTLLFKAIAVSREGISLRTQGIRWSVEPLHLGVMKADGTFLAGRMTGEGLVIAMVQIDGKVYRGEAAVVVSPEAQSAITGLVSGAGNAPLDGAVITATRVGATIFSRKVRSNADGSYFMGGLIAGWYVVKAEKEGYLAEYYQEAGTLLEADPVTLAASDTASGIDFSLEPGSTITGLVSDAATHLPIPGARISLFSEPTGGRRHFETRSDSNGVYRFTALPAGEYLARAEARDYLAEFWQEADSVAAATRIVVGNGDTFEEIHFTLSSGGAITGVVSDAQTSLPVAGAVVTVHSQNRRDSRVTRSDANGVYGVEGLSGGLYLVACAAPGFLPQWYDGVATRREATAVAITADLATEGIDFQLDRPAPKPRSISGVVSDDSSGLPIPHAIIIATPVMHFARPGRTVTAEDGSYVLSGLVPGKYLLAAQARGYIGEFYQDARNWLEATPIEVLAGQEVTAIDLGLTPQPRGAYLISGEVRDRQGKVIADALVSIVTASRPGGSALARGAASQQTVAAVLTDENGFYALEGIPADTYGLSASATGFADLDQSLSVGNGQNAYNTIVTLEAGTTGFAAAAEMPATFALEQNHPNPFNPVTSIIYTLAAPGRVSLQVYNLLGREIKTLQAGEQNAGRYTAVWDGTDEYGESQASGVYFYRLRVESGAETFTQMKRMLLLK